MDVGVMVRMQRVRVVPVDVSVSDIASLPVRGALSVGLALHFVFVKQKTAYEMRISDWSSDVCSSDLTCCSCWDRNSADGLATPRRPRSVMANTDRKSVVLGKSVSVRVDLGGRRIIKKKTTRCTRHVG